MLKIHQRLGLITLAPMAAALITGPMAKAKGRNGQTITEPTNANLDFHAALGGATSRPLLHHSLLRHLRAQASRKLLSTAPFAFTRRWPSSTVPA